MVTVEAIEPGRLVWQVNLTGSIQELIVLEDSSPRRSDRGLMPMLGAAGEGRAAWRSYELNRLCRVVFRKTSGLLLQAALVARLTFSPSSPAVLLRSCDEPRPTSFVSWEPLQCPLPCPTCSLSGGNTSAAFG